MHETIIKIINEVIIPIAGVVISVTGGFISYYVKKFYTKHSDLIEVQKKSIQDKIGIDNYNEDVTIIKNAVYSVEQLGKEFDWEGALKHSKVLEMIEGKTSLTDEEIYNIIKATVLEVNSLKSSNSNIKSNVTVQAK